MDTAREKVKNANLRFYEAAAAHYDSIDPRRARERFPWLESVLRSLHGAKENAALLDAGAGSGFLLRHARGIFPRRIALDQSPRMLERIRDEDVEKLVGSCEKIPLADGSVDVVAAFAVLHHLHDPLAFFSEAHRVLRKGGAVYTDHDLAAPFAHRFRWPLRIWRLLFDHGPEYLKIPEISPDDYHWTEYHGNRGLDGEAWREPLTRLGFQRIAVERHWLGGGAAEKVAVLLGLRKRGPFLRVTAWKD
ncbi:MAG: class I SAM-dependent methyltransferase [Bdellovibrionales bacterium]|nr:class I SAM-dependent methyltransferase [Bdellovibrionales bacterium]